MANTFLHAQGYDVGASLYEAEMKSTAREILKEATSKGCALILPLDVVVANALEPHAPSQVVEVKHIPRRSAILDIGPRSLMQLFRAIEDSKTLVWNGPVGAYETVPFDSSTVQLARLVALRSREGLLHSVAGGGDTVAALAHAGLSGELSYLSTAGGAFLEWLEGKELPGIGALLNPHAHDHRQRA
jgi:phosphoglycerate kinase